MCLPSRRGLVGALDARRRTAADRRRSSCGWCTSRRARRPTLTMSAPASISSRVPSAVTTLPATIGTSGATARTSSMARSVRVWWPWAVSMTSTSTPIAEQRLGLRRRVAVDARRRRRLISRPSASTRRPVDRAAQRTLAGDAAEQPAVVVDHRGDATGARPTAGRRSPPARCRRATVIDLAASSRCCSWVKRSKPIASCSVKMPTGSCRRRRPRSRRASACGSGRAHRRRCACGPSVIGVSYTGWRVLT